MADKKNEPSYRWAAFSHWLNLTVLAGGVAAGATIDPVFFVALVPLQAALLWIVPDLPPFKASVDKRHRAKTLRAERAYCLEQLWGLHPRKPKTGGEKLLGLFVNADPDDYDERVIERGLEFERYLEMRDIVQKLRQMVPLPNVRVTQHDLVRLDEVINGYLRIQMACRPLAAAVHGADPDALQNERQEVLERLEEADATLRPVLVERKRLLDKQLERIPRLQATLELLHARAEAMVYQLRNMHSQVLTDPGTAVHAMLDEMVERNEMLADPLADLRADQSVRELLEHEPASSAAQRGAQRAAAARQRQS
jgi:hypothetical protein